MGKKTFAMLIVAVVALFAGYNMYQSQSNAVALSELALANVEALSNDEVMDGDCAGSWSKECCVCGIKHYTFATVRNSNKCESRSGCAHYGESKDRK